MKSYTLNGVDGKHFWENNVCAFWERQKKTDRDRDKSESVWGQLTTQKARIQDIRQKKN